MTATMLRLAFAGFRSRLLASFLTVVLVGLGAAMLTLALQLTAVADEPWERTFRESNGAHVIAYSRSEEIARIAALDGVSAAAGPVPRVVTSTRNDGQTYGLSAIGLGSEPPVVERPVLTEGRWVAGSRELVLERSFAGVLGLGPGAVLSVKTTNGWVGFEVVGVAVVPSGEPYPESQPGVAFLDDDGVLAIQPARSRLTWIEAIRLENPDEAGMFAGRVEALFPGQQLGFDFWQESRYNATERHHTTTIVLTTYTILVVLAVGFVLATAIGARVLARYREVGLLKSIGFTPRQVAGMFLTEQLVLGLVGSVLGVVAGAVLAPRLARSSTDLVGAVPVTISVSRLILVAAAIEAVVAVVTLVPSLRGGRFTVIHTLNAAGGARVRSRLAGLARLGNPLGLAVGLKEGLARPGRSAAIGAALLLAVSASVAGLAMESTLDREEANETAQEAAIVIPVDPAGLAPQHLDPVAIPDLGRDQIRPIVRGLNALLLAVAVGNLLATALLAVRERIRDIGVLKAIGLTPRQVTGSLFAAHGLVGLVAAGLAIPCGLAVFGGVYRIAGGDADLITMPPAWQLALVPAATALAVVLAAAIPARRAIGIGVAEALRFE